MITGRHYYKGFTIITDTNLYKNKNCYWVGFSHELDDETYFGYLGYALKRNERIMDRLKDIKRSIDEYLERRTNDN